MQGRLPIDLQRLSFPDSLLFGAWLIAAGALTACKTPATQDQASLWEPAGRVTRQESIAIANAYVRHRWRPTEANVFHGTDERGIRVDTPDQGFRPANGTAGWWQPGKVNTGLPYKWGGFDTPQQFDAGLQRGLRAGDVYTPAKRALNNSAVSDSCAGIDCSGFISRCWRLSAPFSTYEIAKICEPLSSFDELRPGDVLNKSNEHICLFAGVEGGNPANLIVYDVGCPPHWKAMKHGTPVAWLRENGYTPWRYRGIVD
jgi:hypothetical protein